MEKVTANSKADLRSWSSATKTARPSNQRNTFLSKKDISYISIGFLGFFIGRVTIFGILNPLAMGFLANFLFRGSLFYMVAIGIGAGFATKLTGIYLLKNIICIGLMVVGNITIEKYIKAPNIFLKSATCGVCVLISGLIFAGINGFSLYFAILTVLEATLAFCLTYVLKKASFVVMGKKRKKVLSQEELISISVLMGGIIAGAADIYIGYVSLRIFLGVMVMLIVAYKGGSSLGATVSILMGLMLYVTGYANANTVLIMSFATITSGLLRGKGKFHSLLGFVIGGSILTFYFDPSIFNIELLFSVAIGGIAFLLMPDNFYFNLGQAVDTSSENSEEYISRIKDITTTRLDAFADAFGNLSKSFSKLSEKRTSLDKNDVSKLIDEISTKACETCKKKDKCWKTNFYDTYQTIFSILSTSEKNGKIEFKDIPQPFKENCVDLEKFVNTSNRLFELYKLNLMWKNRIIESRELVSQQLSGVSSLIKNLSYELDLEINFKENLEEAMILELNKNKIEVDSVIVLENKLGKYEVTLGHKQQHNNKNIIKEIATIVSRILGRKMKPIDNGIMKRGVYSLNFVEEQRYRINSGVAKTTKSGSRESGDSHSFMELRNGQCLLALSDGMGSGDRARKESAAAIELLEDFIESGFDKDMALKMINSALVLKSSEESFSTLDICSVDLYTGEAEFVKIGAATTFLLRNGVVQIIKSTSLPIGILNTVDIEISERQLNKNDVILMVTDGITEVTDTYLDKGAWVAESLANFKGRNPQDIAEHILREAEKKSGGVIKDDMTVMAARVFEK